MLTAYCRNALSKHLVKYSMDEVSLEDIPVVSEEIKKQLGKEYTHPILFSIECGKGSLTTQPEPIEKA